MRRSERVGEQMLGLYLALQNALGEDALMELVILADSMAQDAIEDLVLELERRDTIAAAQRPKALPDGQ
jgi:hypothetical protein